MKNCHKLFSFVISQSLGILFSVGLVLLHVLKTHWKSFPIVLKNICLLLPWHNFLKAWPNYKAWGPYRTSCIWCERHQFLQLNVAVSGYAAWLMLMAVWLFLFCTRLNILLWTDERGALKKRDGWEQQRPKGIWEWWQESGRDFLINNSMKSLRRVLALLLKARSPQLLVTIL